MPRRIKEVKVIAVNDGKNPVKYLTEGIAVYGDPDEFIHSFKTDIFNWNIIYGIVI